jgi:endonuclease YncB( thermonuclease family)
MSDLKSVHETSHSLGNTPIGNAVQMRERMRAIIHAEVEKINPTDDARRALELIIESSLRPSLVDGELHFTAIDASGQPRMRDKDGRQVPLTLQDLIDELRAAHPVLFKSPPKPQASEVEVRIPANPNREIPQPKPEPKRDWLKLDVDEMKPASKPALSLSAHALNHWRKGKVHFHGWSQKISSGWKTSVPPKGSGRIAELGNRFAQPAGRAQALFKGFKERPLSRRPGFASSAVAVALLLVGLGAFFALRSSETDQANTDWPSETGALGSAQASNAPSSAPRSSSSGRTLRGVPDVIDTATLSLEGEVVRLFGVEWAPGAGKPEDLSKYLQGREVTCEPAGGADTYRCKVGEQDLSRVILYNGGGQPTSEATPELKAAADKAREATLGVWSKQP